MGKINKYANIYDTQGNLIRHVGDDGKLKNYTIPELEDLLDSLYEDGQPKDKQTVDNVAAVLQNEYKKDPKYLINKLNSIGKGIAARKAELAPNTTEDEVKKALQEVDEEVTIASQSPDSEQLVERETNYEPESYTDFEEITDSDESSKEIIV